MSKFKIEHKGKILNTTHWINISSEKCSELRDLYYSKPEFPLVQDNLKSIYSGSTKVNYIVDYYFKELMSKTKLSGPKWSIEEVFESDDLIRYFYSRIQSSDTMYPKSSTDIENIKTALRISGGGVCMKPSNFPMKTVDSILDKYNLNNNYYDFSCGWGVRMLSSMKKNINYFGTDPNYKLVEKLEQLHDDYDESNLSSTNIDIRPDGSEIFVPEWENTMGLAFSSPPYYDLEDYKIGAQSSHNRTYNQWLEEYIKQTINNIKKYLMPGGYLLINIKNIKNYPMYDDVLKICKDSGLVFLEELELKNIKRPSAKVNLNTDEKIMVFQK